jgi:hypothetical protein
MTVGERGPRGLTGEMYAHCLSLHVNRRRYLEFMPTYYRNLLRHRCLNKKSRWPLSGTSSF